MVQLSAGIFIVNNGQYLRVNKRITLRGADAAWAQPSGGGYAMSLSAGSSEVLIENGIAVRANKVMAVRSAGAGSVVGYNYMDMSYINTQGFWIETGLNASHLRCRARLYVAVGRSGWHKNRLHTLPAKARYDAGTPFIQP